MVVVCGLDRILCSSRCLCFFSVVPWFIDVFPPGVLFVLMRVEISLFNSGILGSCGVFFTCQVSVCYFLRMGYGRSLSAYWYVFLAWLVKYVGECLVCVIMYVGRCSAVKESCVYLSQSSFLKLVYDRLFFWIVCLLSVCIVSSIGRWSEFSAWIVFQVVML